ncbi:MAG: hypothetical protein GY694_01385, partial [Gammaproteobacteria bacterium]|nr:hypothetical protein [Gammaproteobacteria bacterium]
IELIELIEPIDPDKKVTENNTLDWQIFQDQLLNEIELESSDDQETLLWERLDEMQKQIDDDESARLEQDINVQIALSSTAGMTVGFISWVLRSGSLLASLISAIPLFSRFDPLPILKSRSNKDKEKIKDEDDNKDSTDPETIDEVNELLDHINAEGKSSDKSKHH